ncbi:MAG TPA: fused MFS/spermidine synthase [Gaiellaceae bacterium]|nr:fused MFS/spermidine synthase [Gaiellaceae bacterium]
MDRTRRPSPVVTGEAPGGNGRDGDGRPGSLPAPEGRGFADRFDGAAIMAAVFVSGAVLLGVEIAASRVLAPFFGNSLYVWGSLIGVVLTGLAIGYWLGGVLADRLPVTRLLLGVMGLAALLVLAIPFVDDAVLEWVVGWDFGPRLNPLIASVILFGPMSVAMACVTPIAVRLRARSLARVGRTAGRLFSVSTAGSIAGTLATAFFLIPELGVDQLIATGAAALLAAVVVVAAAERQAAAAAVAALATVGAVVAAVSLAPETGGTLSGAAAQNWSPLYRLRGSETVLDARDPRAAIAQPELRVVFSQDTQYHRLSVVEDADSRYLRFDNSLQSAMYLDDPLRTRFAYTDSFHLAKVYNPDAQRILFIGLGAGSSEKRMLQDFDEVQLHAVEIDPVVADVAHDWFELPRDDPRLEISVGDGRRFLADGDERWDAIVIDAFFADAIPFHLVTQEFLQLARSRLEPGGVVVTNAIGAIAGPSSRLFRSIYRTYRTAFPTVLVHPTILPGDEGDETFRNLILVATESAAPQPTFLAQRWEELRASAPTAPDLRQAILDRHDELVPTDDVPVLTDDYAPTDALLLLFQ